MGARSREEAQVKCVICKVGETRQGKATVTIPTSPAAFPPKLTPLPVAAYNPASVKNPR